MSKTYRHLGDYFDHIRSVLSEYRNLITSSAIIYEVRTGEEGTISGSLTFIDQSELHVREYLVIEQGFLNRLTYRFHWQNDQKGLIKRWDNAPHFRELLTFPHHKHTPIQVEPSKPATLELVLKEIIGQIISEVE